jgi:GlpG protein
MRLLCSIENQKTALAFSNFLTSKEIENECEVVKNTDWGDDDYGKTICRIWIKSEDHVAAALEWFQHFKEHPEDSLFDTKAEPKEQKRSPSEPKPEVMGKITLSILILCSLLFLLTRTTTPPIKELAPNIPYLPVFASPVKKALLFDWPDAYQILNNITETFGIEKLQDPSLLPPKGKQELNLFFNTPYWQGVYDMVVNSFKDIPTKAAPLFEKIRQGEITRLFTPCLLHADIFHLLFNMMWLVVIGKQIENRMGTFPYIAFILIAGIASNIAQYLMSGPNFIGFSGVLCGQIAFVWLRQKWYPWEGYNLQPATAGFILFFVLALFAIQTAGFVIEITSTGSFSPNIANTAHIVGGLSGAVLARFKLFAATT